MTAQPIRRSLSISDWREAPLRVNGETVFAIGDVHGCADQLSLLTETMSELAGTAAAARLIFLGDLICRGADSLGALAQWAAPALDARFGKVHRLTGNHEQLLMLSVSSGEIAESARSKWMSMSGESFVNDLRQKTGRAGAILSRDLLAAAVDPTIMARLETLETHARLGNVIFVHAGIDPALDPDVALALPWTMIGGNHWAWIQEPFIAWRGGFGGLMVVHGHTPPAKHRKMSGYPDPQVFQHDRLCLDGGSASTGTVAAAQLEDGRYRLLTAHAG